MWSSAVGRPMGRLWDLQLVSQHLPTEGGRERERGGGGGKEREGGREREREKVFK